MEHPTNLALHEQHLGKNTVFERILFLVECLIMDNNNITTPHDRFFRSMMTDPKIIREFFEQNLPGYSKMKDVHPVV